MLGKYEVHDKISRETIKIIEPKFKIQTRYSVNKIFD